VPRSNVPRPSADQRFRSDLAEPDAQYDPRRPWANPRHGSGDSTGTRCFNPNPSSTNRWPTTFLPHGRTRRRGASLAAAVHARELRRAVPMPHCHGRNALHDAQVMAS
jgi:hypothetical protein